MMKTKEDIVFILNPISGSGKASACAKYISRLVDKQVYNPKVVYTTGPGNAKELACEAVEEGVKKIVAVGGDGTINEIGHALIGTDAALGIVPSGSGNGLARHLNIPMNPEKAVALINSNRERVIDTCSVNDRPFFCTSGVGFDAHIGHLFSGLKSRGFQGYVSTALKEFFSYVPHAYSIEIEGKTYNVPAFLITFANSAQYGNNAYISPEADICDGLIDVCILSPFPKRDIFNIGYRLFNRSMNRCKHLKIIRTNKIVLKRKTEGMVHLDGEPLLMGEELNVTVHPSSLKVLIGNV
ncbi:diacylglycerol kinase family lipid kinase [Cytophagaceae bacterium ABcell3]|nr:diacylglycerol kinase family lipid kinase [Cytophagaceae bacterium ABcell3]